MSQAGLDIDHLRQWIGRTEEKSRSRHGASRRGIARNPVRRAGRTGARRYRTAKRALVPDACDRADVTDRA